MSEEERKDAKVMQKKLQAILLSTPVGSQWTPTIAEFYVRYADDFLIGVIEIKRTPIEQIRPPCNF